LSDVADSEVTVELLVVHCAFVCVRKIFTNVYHAHFHVHGMFQKIMMEELKLTFQS